MTPMLTDAAGRQMLRHPWWEYVVACRQRVEGLMRLISPTVCAFNQFTLLLAPDRVRSLQGLTGN